jgi:hypothetical protein
MSVVETTFRYPRIIIRVLYVCLGLPLMLFFAPDSAVQGARSQFVVMACLSLILIVPAIIYCSVYTIKIGDNSIEVGAFIKRQIPFQSIQAITYHWVNNGQYLKFTLSTGRNKTIERGVANFDGLAKALYRRVDKSQVTFISKGQAQFE